MPFFSESPENDAIFEMKIDGYWKAADVADFLIKMDGLYAGLNTIFFFPKPYDLSKTPLINVQLRLRPFIIFGMHNPLSFPF